MAFQTLTFFHQTLLGVIGITTSPILGVFCLGIFFRRTTSKGAWIGFISSVCIGLWIFIGSLQYSIPPKSLSLRTDGCDLYDQDDSNTTTVSNTLNVTKWVLNATTEPMEFQGPPIARLYSLSRLWYPTVSFLTCMVFGLLGNLLTGFGDPDDVDPKLICHLPTACCFWLPLTCRTWEANEDNDYPWNDKISAESYQSVSQHVVQHDVKNKTLPEIYPTTEKESNV